MLGSAGRLSLEADMSIRKLVLCAVFAALTCVLAPISFVVGTAVPVTMATFAVMLSGVLLGGRYGAAAQLIYLLLGAAGLPVCAGWTPALSRIVGPTGGYLVGYIPLAFICGAVYSMWGRGSRGVKKYAVMTAGMLAGTVVLYAFGAAWYCIYSGVGVAKALAVCVVPFLIGDAVKITAVALLAPRLERALDKIPGKRVNG